MMDAFSDNDEDWLNMVMSIHDPNVYFTSTPSPEDVLLGRGRRIQRHPGNRAFISQIEDYLVSYHDHERGKKQEIVAIIMDWLAERKGHFLKRSPEGYWVEVSKAIVREKIAQAFRHRKILRQKSQAQEQTQVVQVSKGVNPTALGICEIMRNYANCAAVALPISCGQPAAALIVLPTNTTVAPCNQFSQGLPNVVSMGNFLPMNNNQNTICSAGNFGSPMTQTGSNLALVPCGLKALQGQVNQGNPFSIVNSGMLCANQAKSPIASTFAPSPLNNNCGMLPQGTFYSNQAMAPSRNAPYQSLLQQRIIDLNHVRSTA